MIIVNGTLEPMIKQAQGIDPETGYAAQPTAEQWGCPIPCQIVAQSYDRMAVTQQGEHMTAATYAVYIDMQPFPFEQVRLTGRHGQQLGEFPVTHTEPLEAVDQLRLWL